MKKLKVFAVLAAMGLAVSCYSEKIPKGFVKIPAASIDGTETWTPIAPVLGGKHEIASFYMSDHPVIRGEFKAVVGFDPSTYFYEKNVKNAPVINVDLRLALLYCNLRSDMENLTPCYLFDGKIAPDKDWRHAEIVTYNNTANGYRLPTDVEWEWAARGGESYKYAGSDDIDEVGCFIYEKVKSKKANGYGLYDMCGELWERCLDEKDWTSSVKERPRESLDDCLRGGVWYIDRNGARVKEDVNILFAEPLYADVGDIDLVMDKISKRYWGFRVVRNAN